VNRVKITTTEGTGNTTKVVLVCEQGEFTIPCSETHARIDGPEELWYATITIPLPLLDLDLDAEQVILDVLEG